MYKICINKYSACRMKPIDFNDNQPSSFLSSTSIRKNVFSNIDYSSFPWVTCWIAMIFSGGFRRAAQLSQQSLEFPIHCVNHPKNVLLVKVSLV